MSDDIPQVHVGSWVTNLEPMLGEPHEVLAMDGSRLTCVAPSGHMVQIEDGPDVRLCDSPAEIERLDRKKKREDEQ